MQTTIIDYGSGNLRSAAKAFERASVEAGIKGNIVVTSDPKALKTASHIVLPGVGAFADCLQGIKAVDGLVEELTAQVTQNKKWFLGICVGMQLMLSRGFEHGEHKGFGWIEGEVVKLVPSAECLVLSENSQKLSTQHLAPSTFKIPHMGWNELNLKTSNSALLKGIQTGAHAYFVHSYYAQCKHAVDVLATVEYGGEVTAIIGRENMFGTQFHPEKSQATGLQLIRNFLAL